VYSVLGQLQVSGKEKRVTIDAIDAKIKRKFKLICEKFRVNQDATE